jgi:hypothetical protein
METRKTEDGNGTAELKAAPAKRRRQKDLPGMVGSGVEAMAIPAIDAAVEGLLRANDRASKAKEEQTVAKDALVGLMRKHKLEVYLGDQKEVRLKHKDQVTVKARAHYAVGEMDDGEDGE